MKPCDAWYDGASDSQQSFDKDTETIRFQIAEGSLHLHFSFLLKLFGATLRDALGGELVYRINNQKKISRLELIELTPLSGDLLKIAATPHPGAPEEKLWIDIVHPDFPQEKDIGITATTVSFLGTEVELLNDHLIRIGNNEPQYNKEAWLWFDNNLRAFRGICELPAPGHNNQLHTKFRLLF